MKYAVLIFICSYMTAASGQWTKVFTASNIVTSGFFHNEFEGCIGTGHYEAGGPAQIYFTTDAGATWTLAAMPAKLTGHVTDIFFRDKLSGWAAVKNVPEMGWSGIYHTSDGGRSWAFRCQLTFPVSVRETAKGVFVADRMTGIMRSVDQGRNFTIIEQFTGALGLDFLDDNIGIASGESIPNSPIQITLDGGITWIDKVLDREAWTAFADPITRRMYYASERDDRFPASESAVGLTSDNGMNFSIPKVWSGNSLTGGIAGSKKCKSVIYLQGQDLPSSAIKGMLRSTDNGQTWVVVGGPASINDSRFAVTSRGAVVYAFDRLGGVWKTTNGGDGTISSSVQSSILIQAPTNTSSARLCDSVTIRIPIRFSGCEEIRIVSVVSDDEIIPLSAPQTLLASATTYDTIVLRYRPQQTGSSSKPLRISYLQADGAPDDTVINILVNGIAIPDEPQVTSRSGGKLLSFGDISVCGGDSSDVITVTNQGCAAMRVNELRINNAAFTLQSSFKPFTLDPGTSRKFLVKFKPQLITGYSGSITVVTSNGLDSIAITGAGIQGSRAMRLTVPVMETTLCDTAEYILVLRNISCSDITLDSIDIDAPFALATTSEGISLATDSTLALRIRLVPITAGTFTRQVRIYSVSKGERFDTTITITAIVSPGIAVLSLTADTIDFGEISTCSFAEASFTLANRGCDSLHGTLDAASAGDFTVSGIGAFDVARGSSKNYLVTFKPSALGPQTTTITIVSNGGSRTIVIRGVGISGGGTVQGMSDSIGSLLTCREANFVIRFLNTACDSVFFDSLVTSGSGASDYVISMSGLVAIAVSDTATVQGLFSPQAEGMRPVTFVFYFHTRSGTVYTVPITINGGGIEPPTLALSMPALPQTAKVATMLHFPVELTGVSGVPVSALTFTVQTYTDFIELSSFDLDPQYVSVAALDAVVQDDSVWVRLRFTPPIIIRTGKLGDLNALTYLSDTLEADVMLTNFTLVDDAGSSICLPSSFDPAPIHITLDPQCGDLTLSKYMQGRIDFVGIESIVPNPASGRLTLTLQYPKYYRGSCTIDIIDADGRIVSQHVAEGSAKSTVPITLDVPSGPYQVRVTSSGGSVVRSLQIVK